MNLMDRKTAKEQGLKFFYTGRPCHKGHVDKRLVSTKKCYTCSKLMAQEYKAKNKEKIQEYNKQYRENNLEYVRNLTREYNKNNPRRKDYMKKYVKENAAYFNSRNSLRRALIDQRMPAWADIEKIEAIYKECAQITRDTGIVHHVDHYYPLQGKNVSGLHVHFNLRIVPASENLTKYNKHPDE